MTRPQVFGFWDHFATVPYLPVAAWVAFVGWVGLFSGGIAPAGGNALPHWLILAWTASFAFGATLAVIGGTTRRNRVEASGLFVLLTGLVFYGIVALADGINDPVGTAVSVVAFAAMCGIRLRVLALARKAQETAATLRSESDQ